jgi:hypothetical protein
MSFDSLVNAECCCGGAPPTPVTNCHECSTPSAPLTCTWTYSTNPAGTTFNSFSFPFGGFPPPGAPFPTWTSAAVQLPGDYYGSCGELPPGSGITMAGCYALVTMQCRSAPVNFFLTAVPTANPATGTICPQAPSCVNAFAGIGLGRAAVTCTPLLITFIRSAFDRWDVTYP